MENIIINKRTYLLGGKIRGSMNNKINRATKLAYQFEYLDNKFRGIIERGIATNTEHSRCALALLLMMHTGIRVGNEGSAEGYYTKPHPHNKDQTIKFAQTYGLTTLQWDHLRMTKNMLQMEFVGKKQVDNVFTLYDKQILEALKTLCKVEGYWEFPNCKEVVFDITVYMLTKFIKKYVGRGYSPKDFRCMKANLLAADYIHDNFKKVELKKEFKPQVKAMFEFVAEKLNNTPSVCKKSYVGNELIELAETVFLTK